MEPRGYQPDFIDKAVAELSVPYPTLNSTQLEDLAPVGDDEGALSYIHYSVKLSSSRKFPFFTASNIDGKQFIRVKRADVFDSGRDEWRSDERAQGYQWGQVLYDAPKSYFDRGHMAKREDPQWGPNREFARKAAQSTFYFPNCVPQLKELNQRIWQSLETYILSKEAVEGKLKICVFTGPVLSENDPVFVTEVDGQQVLLPVLFWKVVYYTNDGKKLWRVAFLMGQEDLLIENGIARQQTDTRTLTTAREDFFMDYEDAETYQVNIKTVEELTGLKFADAVDPYTDDRPLKLIKKQVQAKERNLLAVGSISEKLGVSDFEITNLTL